MSESWADKQVREKAAQIDMDELREQSFGFTRMGIAMGFDVDTFVAMLIPVARIGMEEAGAPQSEIAKALFVIESWMREAYEQTEKGDEKEE